MSAPPAYEEVGSSADPPGYVDLDLTASFANLRVDSSPHDPDPDTCLVHLKLLFAFQNLKDDIGYTDGIFGIWDSRADCNIVVAENGDLEEHPYTEGGDADADAQERRKSLSVVREKRWALFVARAVDRYESWWNTVTGERPLVESDMNARDSLAFSNFPLIEESSYWEKRSLPPLGMLIST